MKISNRIAPRWWRLIVGAMALALAAGLPARARGQDESPASEDEKMDSGLPNLPFKTLGGKQFWSDEKIYSSWRVQKNVWTGHYRLLDPDNIRRAWGTYQACDAELGRLRDSGQIPVPSTNTVILLHGIWRAKESLRKLETALRAEGYEAIGLNYPSTQAEIEEHAEQLHGVLSKLEGAEKIHLVGHSMGGLVARQYLQEHKDPRIGRLVMIGTPNQGSEMANLLDNLKLLGPTFGPAGPQMRTDEKGNVSEMAVPWCEFGVIAGGKGDGDGYNPLLEGDNDFTVEVESAKLEGMDDFLLVKSGHTFLMDAPETIAGVIGFLRNGKFPDSGKPEPAAPTDNP